MPKNIHKTPEKIAQYAPLNELIGLQDLLVVGHEYDEIHDRTLLICAPRWPLAVCPECGSVSQKIHDYPNHRMVYHTPIGGRPTVLEYDSRRFVCSHCGIKFMEKIRDVVGSCGYTYQLMAEVADARRKQSIATLATIYQLGYKQVESIILKAGSKKLDDRKKSPISVKNLGIDEISLRKGQGNYVLVLTDLEKRIVLDILPDRRKESLIEWLEEPPLGIDLSSLDTVAIDLWTQYRDAVQQIFPHVSIVADRFHVVQNLNKAIDQIRRDKQSQAKDDEEKKNTQRLTIPLTQKQAPLD